MLAALVGLAGDNPAVFGALVARMESGQTPRRLDVPASGRHHPGDRDRLAPGRGRVRSISRARAACAG